jgi:hypothetical protein
MSRPRFRQPVPLVLCLAMPALAGPGSLQEAEPFALAPADLLKASEAVPVRLEYPISILMIDEAVTLDREGRHHVRRHIVYRLDHEAAIPYWGATSAFWSAWHEERPVLRARVINADGVEHVLDPGTLAEFQPQQKDPEVFTDRKELKAPLPMVAKGSVVEVEILDRETRPFSSTGVRSSFTFDGELPVACARFTLDVPQGQYLKLKCEGFDEKRVQRVVRDQVVHYSLAMAGFPVQKRRER